MSDFTDKLTLLIEANAAGALNVIKGFGTQTQSELAKLEAAAGTSGANAGSAFGKNLQNQTLLAVAGLQATVGTIGVGLFAKSSLDDAVNLARANAALSAELKGTASAAGITMTSIDALSQSIQNQDVIYAGTVKGAAALLASYDQVRNQAGQGNDIFDRTLQVGAAVSNLFGRDLNSTVTLLGKALEDPAQGMLQLRRAMIPVSQATQDQIKLLQSHGDQLGAQRVLLDDLQKRFEAAGAAAGKADPFQQFGVSITELKTQIGQDLLPAATVLSDMFGTLAHLPGPIRGTVEALAATGLVVAPLLKVYQVLTAIQAASTAVAANAGIEAAGGAGGAATSTAVQTAALADNEQLLAAAGLEAAAAQDRLALAIDTVAGGAVADDAAFAELAAAFDAAAAAEENLTAASAALDEALAATSETAATTGASLTSLLGPVAAIGGGLLVFGGIADQIGNHAPSVDRMAESIKNFANTGQINGALLQAFGTDLKNFNRDAFAQGQIANTGTFALPGIHQITELGQTLIGQKGAINTATSDVKNFDAALAQLVNSGDIKDANSAFQTFGPALEAAGAKFPLFNQSIDDYIAKASAAATSTTNLSDAFHTFATGLDELKGSLSIQDAFDAVSSAQDKVKQDFADIAGTSDKAIQANKDYADAVRGVADADQSLADAHQRVSDSYTRLQDAQDQVTTSLHSLFEAQQALDNYNSARGAEERALKLDEIQRRVVTTPSEYDQKQLDLLQFQDDNQTKQQQLQDAVTSAQKGYRDALKGVADAQRGIADAERGVEDATQRVADAEDRVRQATEKRKAVHDDAAAAIQGDERKVEESVLKVVDAIDNAITTTGDLSDATKNYITYLDAVAAQVDPNGPISKGLDTILFKATAIAGVSQKQVEATVAQQVVQLGAGQQVIPPAQLNQILHDIGVPGYAFGGTVPGPVGRPQLALVHGGERILTPAQQQNGVTVNQTNNFNGHDTPTAADLDYTSRALAWELSRLGR